MIQMSVVKSSEDQDPTSEDKRANHTNQTFGRARLSNRYKPSSDIVNNLKRIYCHLPKHVISNAVDPFIQ